MPQMPNRLPPQLNERVISQLLIVLTKRLGGKVTIPCAELDDTGQDVVTLEIQGTDFILEATKKS